MGLLKELWDMITVVESSMAAWRTTPWREIHVEDMELECKRFSKDIRGLDKEVGAAHQLVLILESFSPPNVKSENTVCKHEQKCSLAEYINVNFTGINKTKSKS